MSPENRKLVRSLSLLAVAMFGFGFAMWPLYTVFCEVTGFGGKGVKIGQNPTLDIVQKVQRKVNIRFDANVNSALPWQFEAVENKATVQLGIPSEALYLAHNQSDQPIIGHATFNVTPPEASLYFVKTECFCFTQQLLAENETKEMPVYFYIKDDLPERIDEVTLSYTFYRSDDQTLAQQQ